LKRILERLQEGEQAKVIVYGTSLTAGGEWTKALKAWFDGSYPEQVAFVNSARGGVNSAWGNNNLQEKVLSHHPDLVFLEFSYNDAIDDRLTIAEAKEHLLAMVRGICDHNVEAAIVLQIMHVGWDPSPDHRPFSRRANLEAFNQIYRETAREFQIPLIDHFATWEKLKQEQPEAFRAALPDGSHPTPEASLRITWPPIRALLEGCKNL
jgi:lysophospholipase L1-like esterase